MPGPAHLPPFIHRHVSAGEISIHVAELPGAGPPLVLLHGIGMDWRVWQAMSRRLHPHFHLYAVDLRGHGDSHKPEAGYSVAHYAADVEDALEALAVEKAVLVGSSLGAMVSVVVEAPSDLVAKRILVDPPMTGGPIRDPEMFRHILHLKHEPLPSLAAYLGGFNPGSSPFWLETMSAMWHHTADGVITEMLAQADTYFDVGPNLLAVETPTLLLQADPDLGAALTDRGASWALSRLAQGTVVRVPGAGHAIHALKPVEFARLVIDFGAQSSAVSMP